MASAARIVHRATRKVCEAHTKSFLQISHIFDPNNRRSCVKCNGHCPKTCRGDKLIDSVAEALRFRHCNIVDGSLDIEIRVGSEANVEKFVEAFSQIEEITGYLNIRFSSFIVSLYGFKRLRVIHGKQLWRNNYSLVVFDNQNLRELFNLKRQNITILRGKAQFQNNRMLCYNKIEAFLEHVNMLENVTDIDVSRYSNGDKAVRSVRVASMRVKNAALLCF